MPTKLRTRKPTGKVPWPMLVVEGAEKTGKSYISYALSASPKVGRTLVFDMGEGSGDEYAALGPYELVEHDGTWSDFITQLQAAASLPPSVDGPTVIVIDSASIVWQLLKDWGELRARRGKKARALLAKDPDAEISIPMNIWTDIGDRWGHMIHTLRHAPVISILICRGRDVAKVGGDGQPVAGETDYKIEAHKSTLFQASLHVRCLAPKQTKLISVRSLRGSDLDLGPTGRDLPDTDPLEHLIFDVLAAGQDTFAESTTIEPQPDERTVATAKRQLVSILERAQIKDATVAAAALWKSTDGLPRGANSKVTDDAWTRIVDAAATLIATQTGPDPRDDQ